MTRYARSPDDLRKRAILYWPSELLEKERSASVVPMLLATQDKFISILDIADSDPSAWKIALGATQELPANLFLKHLMVLSDVSGETLNRIHADFSQIFPEAIMHYGWRGRPYDYRFAAFPSQQVHNKTLRVDGEGLHVARGLDPLVEDAIMLLLHGAACTSGSVPEIIRERCIIGTLVGEKEKLEQFVKQRYIWVSRITGGATANTLGQIAQNYVRDILVKELPGWTVARSGSIPGMSQNAGETDISFDIVARSPQERFTAIEVCFQFTTNSVIERKSGQAETRANLLHNAGHRIAYVIDGAGNFERISALANICKHSDCTVAFSPEEIGVLVDFLRER